MAAKYIKINDSHVCKVIFKDDNTARKALQLIMECKDEVFDMEYFIQTQS